MTKITDIALGILYSLALATSGLQIIAINKDNKNGTSIFAAVFIPAKMIKIAAIVTKTLTVLVVLAETPINEGSIIE